MRQFEDLVGDQRFFVDNFEASLGLELWRGNDPEIYKIIPELRYVSPTGETFKPYAALFLTRTFYANTVASHNSFGVRAELLASAPDELRRWSPLAQDQYFELRTLLAGYLLGSQGDRMLMAHSVEGRFPFLDRDVVELGCALPARCSWAAHT